MQLAASSPNYNDSVVVLLRSDCLQLCALIMSSSQISGMHKGFYALVSQQIMNVIRSFYVDIATVARRTGTQ